MSAGLASGLLETNYAPAFKYYVEILGIVVGEFTKVSGIDLVRDIKKYKEGGLNFFEHNLPGTISYGNITLERGISYSPWLWVWAWMGIFDAAVLKTNMTIILGTSENKIAKNWNIRGAFPVKYTGPTLEASSTSIAIETIELAHGGIFPTPLSGIPMST